MSDEKTTEAAETEAQKIEAEIEETKEEAKEAREAGEHDKANKLEERVDALAIDLGDIKDALKKLAERPFAPAPQPVKQAEQQAEKKAEKKEEPAEEKPKERKHRFGSTRWFGDRAYED